MRNDQTGDVFKQRRDTALLGDYDRSAGGDRFRGGVAKIFILRGQDKNVGVSIGSPFVLCE